MRVLILAKSTPESENKKMDHSEMDFEAMVRFEEELTSAGVLLASGRLQPSIKGARVRFEGTDRTVIDGPFTESKELVAGYWLWQVRSLDEAVEWLKRAPMGDGSEFEIRPEFDMEGPANATAS